MQNPPADEFIDCFKPVYYGHRKEKFNIDHFLVFENLFLCWVPWYVLLR